MINPELDYQIQLILVQLIKHIQLPPHSMNCGAIPDCDWSVKILHQVCHVTLDRMSSDRGGGVRIYETESYHRGRPILQYDEHGALLKADRTRGRSSEKSHLRTAAVLLLSTPAISSLPHLFHYHSPPIFILFAPLLSLLRSPQSLFLAYLPF